MVIRHSTIMRKIHSTDFSEAAGWSADEALDVVGAEPGRLVVLARGFELGEHVLGTDRITVGVDIDVG